jgi:hypothetical protein
MRGADGDFADDDDGGKRRGNGVIVISRLIPFCDSQCWIFLVGGDVLEDKWRKHASVGASCNAGGNARISAKW